MRTKCRKMLQGVGVALLIAVRAVVLGASSQSVGDDDFIVDVNDNSWVCSAFPTGCVEFAGYKLGEAYHSLTNGGRVIYVDVLNYYTHSAALDPPFHGIESVNMRLSSASRSLMSMNASRIDFKDRQDLMNEGLSALQDLGRHFGILLSRFKFTAPDWPYWPSRKLGYLWEGSMPELLKVDDSLWPTAKTIFATSDTNMGDYSVQVRLGVVDYDEYEMSISLSSKSASEKSEKEFHSAFRAKHDGKTYDEWSAERQYRNSPEFKINDKRKPFTNRLDIAGWTLDSVVEETRCRNEGRRLIAGGRCVGTRLPEPFLDIYPYVDVSLDESNRVSKISLQTDRIKNASEALEWFRKTKEFLINQGMDDCYKAKMTCSAEEIEQFINTQSTYDLRSCIMRELQWVDKSKTLLFVVDIQARMPHEAHLHFSVSRLRSGVPEYMWQQCMDAAIRRRSGRRPAESHEPRMKDAQKPPQP